MIYAGIDVAKDKHDCFICNSDGKVLFNAFTFPNNMQGFEELYQRIKSVSEDLSKVKVGLEATGHYSYNLLGFLLDKGLPTFVINPLHANLYRKSLTLRKTKTDKVDAHTITMMLMSDVNLKSYSNTLYHNEELKSLTRYRFDKVQERAKLKTSIARLVNILFPELEKLVPRLHMKSIYALLSEFPSAHHIAEAHLTKLTNLLYEASKGRYNRDVAIRFREAARNSIGSVMPAKSLELKHTIKLISELDTEINEIEEAIKSIMDEINSPILSIPGISYRMGAMIIAEIGDFERFSSPDKILAYAGLSPSTYQSGQMQNCYSHMEKRGSRYLRYALFNATRFVCHWDSAFGEYLAKKQSEGKHYYVAVSHAAKKLVRLIYHLEKTGQLYKTV
ncbi:MAG: IS110 family transposase [Clostridia bacterium]|nr:IS110 family transposase [Clostridia bacterium]